MAVVVVLLLGVGLILGGAGLLLWGKARRGRVRTLPRSRAREARPGTFVKVVGRLRAKAPVRAPLTGEDCMYCRVRVTEGTGEDARELFTQTEYAKGWMLEDESGRIGLEPARASLVFLDEHQYSSGEYPNGSRPWSEALPEYVHSKTGTWLEEFLSLSEERLDVGATVVALGQVALGPSGPVLVAGPRLEVFQGTEQEVLEYKGYDLMSWMMLAGGVLTCVAGAVLVFEEPEPVPVVKDQPLRPLAPTRAGARPE